MSLGGLFRSRTAGPNTASGLHTDRYDTLKLLAELLGDSLPAKLQSEMLTVLVDSYGKRHGWVLSPEDSKNVEALPRKETSAASLQLQLRFASQRWPRTRQLRNLWPRESSWVAIGEPLLQSIHGLDSLIPRGICMQSSLL